MGATVDGEQCVIRFGTRRTYMQFYRNWMNIHETGSDTDSNS